MNKKRNVDSGRKSARPDYIQKTISQKSSGKRSGKVFFPKTLIKTGGIIIFVLLLGFAGNKFFLSVSKTDSGKVKAVSASGADEEKEGRIIEKTKKTKEIKETKDVVEMQKTKEINFQPHCVDSTKPENLISYTNIEVDGNVLENIGDYKADGDISFNIGQDYTDVDGMITNVPGICLVTSYADCVPLYFVDPVKKAIGLSHSGWRGTVGKIGKNTVQLMQENFGSKPEDLLAAVGPSVCMDCYEVSEDVIEQFKEAFEKKYWEDLFYKKENGKYQLNLWKANELIFLESGILPEHMAITNVCTHCNSKILYSHRTMGNNRGNLCAFLALK